MDSTETFDIQPLLSNRKAESADDSPRRPGWRGAIAARQWAPPLTQGPNDPGGRAPSTETSPARPRSPTLLQSLPQMEPKLPGKPRNRRARIGQPGGGRRTLMASPDLRLTPAKSTWMTGCPCQRSDGESRLGGASEENHTDHRVRGADAALFSARTRIYNPTITARKHSRVSPSRASARPKWGPEIQSSSRKRTSLVTESLPIPAAVPHPLDPRTRSPQSSPPSTIRPVDSPPSPRIRRGHPFHRAASRPCPSSPPSAARI